MSARHRTRDELREDMRRAANRSRDTADEMALMYGGCDDPLHPFMPVGEDQPFRDWSDFVARVARPLAETDDDGVEQAAMALYRKASPFFLCAALVMAANEIDRLRAAIERAIDGVLASVGMGPTYDILRQALNPPRVEDSGPPAPAASTTVVSSGDMAVELPAAVDRVVDLMDALEKSVAAAKDARARHLAAGDRVRHKLKPFLGQGVVRGRHKGMVRVQWSDRVSDDLYPGDDLELVPAADTGPKEG